MRLPVFADSAEQRLKIMLAIFFLGIWVFFLFNNLLPMLNMDEGRWVFPDFAPYIVPLGDDFREGYYYPAKILLQGKSMYQDYNSVYPPFSSLFATPFRLFDVNKAYLLNVCLLFALNIANVALGVMIARRVFPQAGKSATAIQLSLLSQIAAYAVTCYGFLFSVERGNMDTYPMFFSLLALWIMTGEKTKSGEVWWSTLLIGMATHLKIYPVVLFAIVIWKYGWKSLLPIVLVNLGLYFSTGLTNAVQFAQQVGSYAANPFIWVGNHSAASFAHYINSYFSERIGMQFPVLLFYLLPLVVWVLGFWLLWHRGYSAANATWLFLLSVPLMSVIPSVSHDYKLVILTPIFATFLYWLIGDHTSRGRMEEVALLLALMVLLYLVGRSPVLLPTLLKNKYPFVIIFQFLTLLGITLELRRTKKLPSNLPAES